MIKKQKVFIVLFSDRFSVKRRGVFTTRKKAKDYIKKDCGDWGSLQSWYIEEYTLDNPKKI